MTHYCFTFKDAQLQIIRNDYAKCAKERDEYKHQLDAANKEIEVLKHENKDLKTIIDDSSFGFQCRIHELEYDLKTLKEINEKLNLQITALHKIIEGGKKTIDEQKEEIEKTRDWKEIIETFKNMKTQGFEDYDPRDFEK